MNNKPIWIKKLKITCFNCWESRLIKYSFFYKYKCPECGERKKKNFRTEKMYLCEPTTRLFYTKKGCHKFWNSLAEQAWNLEVKKKEQRNAENSKWKREILIN